MKLGVLIPALVLTFFLTDVALRFVPKQYFAFRPWEALSRSHQLIMPVKPNQHLCFPHSYGDLSIHGNIPQVRQTHFERFSTDSLGFRNLESKPTKPLDVLIFGDSFALGLSLDDTQTLGTYLADLSHKHVYNAGMAKPSKMNSLLDTLPLKPNGLVIYEVVDYMIVQLYQPAPQEILNYSLNHLLVGLAEHLPAQGWITYSPVAFLSNKLIGIPKNDVILPNSVRERVIVRRLQNGELMLFSQSDPNPPITQPSAIFINTLDSLVQKAREKDLRFIVLIVPNKLRVYSQLLEHSLEFKDNFKSLLTQFENKLQKNHIEYLDLTDCFRSAAKDAFACNQYVYWRDDIHWNSYGTHIAAEQIKDHYLSSKEAHTAP